jgi:DNA-directed RNA polymerase subunit RPC12/RpoP
MDIICSNCHKKFIAPDEYKGKKTKCPHCGSIILIGASERMPDFLDSSKQVQKQIPPAQQIEACKNCGETIGKLEKAFMFQGDVVCGKCYKKLHVSIEKYPSPEYLEAKAKIVNWLSRRKDRSGVRSFMFQVILATWTLFMIIVAVFYFIVIAPPEPARYMLRTNFEEALGKWFLTGICCPFCAYVVIAFPLICFAFATYGKSKE